MTTACSECGAALPEGRSCRDLFDASQVAELEQPGYFAVHHLSVPCYLLQHQWFSRDGWLETREMLRRFVVEKLPPNEARREQRSRVDSGSRDWNFGRGPRMPGTDRIVWSRTIADVRLDTVEHYREDVTRWAERVIADTQELA